MKPATRATGTEVPPAMGPVPKRLVLIGFMGAGKSTVGQLLAAQLGWEFIDLDEEVARREGRPVYEIIRSSGLRHFRRVESDAGREAVRRTRVVVAVGGGWPAEAGHMDLLAEGTGSLSVWLRVSPRTALARVADSNTPRPLLEVPDPTATAEALLSRRRAHYRLGHVRIDTDDLTPDEIVRDILKRLTPRMRDDNKEETA